MNSTEINYEDKLDKLLNNINKKSDLKKKII